MVNKEWRCLMTERELRSDDVNVLTWLNLLNAENRKRLLHIMSDMTKEQAEKGEYATHPYCKK